MPLSTSSICSTNLSAASPVSVGIGFATYILKRLSLYFFLVVLTNKEYLLYLATFGRKGNTFFSISVDYCAENHELYAFLTIYGIVGWQNGIFYPQEIRLHLSERKI